MLNGMKKAYEKHLKVAFESGYTNAALSLSKMAKDKIFYNNFHLGFHKLDSDFLKQHGLYNRNGSNVLLTTEIFGDITGKSYLFLSDKEFEVLTAGVPESKDPKVNFKEEFSKEVDNILSASVITRLSNELKVKMYGDIPILVGKVSGEIEDIINDDFKDQGEEIYINSISFSFETQPVISPIFVWVVNTHTLNVLKPQPALL